MVQAVILPRSAVEPRQAFWELLLARVLELGPDEIPPPPPLVLTLQIIDDKTFGLRRMLETRPGGSESQATEGVMLGTWSWTISSDSDIGSRSTAQCRISQDQTGVRRPDKEVARPEFVGERRDAADLDWGCADIFVRPTGTSAAGVHRTSWYPGCGRRTLSPTP